MYYLCELLVCYTVIFALIKLENSFAMKLIKFMLAVLLAATLLAGCSTDERIELPLTMHDGYGPFQPAFAGIAPAHDAGSPWYRAFPKVSKFPDGLINVQLGSITANMHQIVYQSYHSGNISKEFYKSLQNSWNWTPDTTALSKTPVKSQIAFVYGEDADGAVKFAVDANGNLDLSDDALLTPISMMDFWTIENRDSLVQAHAVRVSLERFVRGQTVSIAPLLFVVKGDDMWWANFVQYATASYKGQEIAISSGSGSENVSYQDPRIALMPADPKVELWGEGVNQKGEYIEIEDEVLKIVGVDMGKNVLVLEKIGKPKAELFSTQKGYRLRPFEGEDFTTKAPVSSDSLKGKYVLVDFWSTWCGPCIEDFPYMKELYSKTDRSRFEIVGIVGESGRQDLTGVIEKNGIVWPQILSDDINKLVEAYGITGYPTTFLIDPEGMIVAKKLRVQFDEEKILDLIGE